MFYPYGYSPFYSPYAALPWGMPQAPLAGYGFPAYGVNPYALPAFGFLPVPPFPQQPKPHHDMVAEFQHLPDSWLG